MLYSIIEVSDQALKDRLAVTCDNQPFIAKAPLVLIFLADCQRWWDVFAAKGVPERCQELNRPFHQPREGNLLLAACDALIAAQNAVVAAEALGIGSCYIGDILENYEIHRELLGLPDWVLPITMLCFGRPAAPADFDSPIKRFYAGYNHFQNAYRRLEPQEIEVMMQPLEERFAAIPNPPTPARNAAQNTYLLKFGSDFSEEMTRSVRAMLKPWMERQIEE